MYKFLFAAMIACGVMACSKNDNQPPPAPAIKGIMPLNTGNYWYYKKTIHDSATGSVKAVTGDTIGIISQVSINDVAYFQQYQASIVINSTSFFVNVDSNTVQKIDSATKYTFFKRVTADQTVGTWADTVKSRCTGTNELHAYAGDSTVNGYSGCLKNIVFVTDCTHETFQKWVYYLKPNVGLVRMEHYLLKTNDGSFYLDFEEDLQSYHLQ